MAKKGADFFESLKELFFETLPKELGSVEQALKDHFNRTLRQVVSRMELVSREEFDAQVRVLKRLREQLEMLEAQIESQKKE